MHVRLYGFILLIGVAVAAVLAGLAAAPQLAGAAGVDVVFFRAPIWRPGTTFLIRRSDPRASSAPA